MKCPSCGSENAAGTKFCSLCGTKLPLDGAEQPTNAQSAQQPVPPTPQQPNTYQNAAPQYQQYQQYPQPPKKEPLSKQTWFVVLMLILVWPVGLILMWCNKKEWKLPVKIIITAFFALMLIIGAASGSGSSDDSEETEKATEAVTAEPTEAPTEAPTTPVPTEDPSVTIGMKNALKTAQSYLNISAFSYTGLIDQLEYEKYSVEEATYAADNCGADWNEQAAKCAQNYIDLTSFSRDGLIDQLIYEGFTQEQAEYGAQAVGY